MAFSKQQQEEVKTEPLPDDKDEFWKGAVRETHTVGKPVKCEHNYVMRSAREAVCHCGSGFFLTPGMTVEDGHIYSGSQLVI